MLLVYNQLSLPQPCPGLLASSTSLASLGSTATLLGSELHDGIATQHHWKLSNLSNHGHQSRPSAAVGIGALCWGTTAFTLQYKQHHSAAIHIHAQMTYDTLGVSELLAPPTEVCESCQRWDACHGVKQWLQETYQSGSL